MRRPLDFPRPETQTPDKAKPVPDYQSREAAEAEQQQRKRRWYQPDLRWATNRDTVVGCLTSALGELFAFVVGIVVLYLWWRWS